MGRLLVSLAALALLCLGAAAVLPRWNAGPALPAEAQVKASAGPETVVRRAQIADGDTFAFVVESLGLTYGDAMDILEASAEVYDFTRIRSGRFLVWEETLQGEPLRLSYEPGPSTVIVVEASPEGWKAREEAIAYEVELVAASGTIASSLFGAAAASDIPDPVILEMADALAWTIDFATQVQEGDSFEVLYEKRFRDGAQAGTGRVLAASFTNVGRRYEAYLFESGASSGYYDEDGASLVRQFLKAPLSYSRISSGYATSRFHPWLGRSTPHRAIDYAAPTGTPILATADGTVTYAQWNSGGYGNFVKIRHNSVYDTHYAHLSRFAKGIRPGTAVKQGEVIGYVGSTGFSTGPHLHYEISENGALVNPLEIELPAGDPIAEGDRPSFEARRDELRALLTTPR